MRADNSRLNLRGTIRAIFQFIVEDYVRAVLRLRAVAARIGQEIFYRYKSLLLIIVNNLIRNQKRFEYR